MDPKLEYRETGRELFGHPVFEVVNGGSIVGVCHRVSDSRWKGTNPNGKVVTARTRNHVGIVMAQWAGA